MVHEGVQVREHQIQELIRRLTLILLTELTHLTSQRNQACDDVTLHLRVELVDLSRGLCCQKRTIQNHIRQVMNKCLTLIKLAELYVGLITLTNINNLRGDLDDQITPHSVVLLPLKEGSKVVILQLLKEHLHDQMVVPDLLQNVLFMHRSEW